MRLRQACDVLLLINMQGRILIVDDDAEAGLLMRTILQSADYQTLVLTDPAKAIARYQPDQFDLLITDKNMPGLSGFELIRELRLKSPTLPAIMMTAFPELGATPVAIQGYLAKPFVRLRHVIETVERTLSMSRLMREMQRRQAGTSTHAA